MFIYTHWLETRNPCLINLDHIKQAVPIEGRTLDGDKYTATGIFYPVYIDGHDNLDQEGYDEIALEWQSFVQALTKGKQVANLTMTIAKDI